MLGVGFYSQNACFRQIGLQDKFIMMVIV